MKKFATLLAKPWIPIIFLFCSILSYSQNINGRFSSSIYSFERFDTTDISNIYIRTYQTLTLNVNQDKFSLRSYLNFESDLSQNIKDDPRLRFYNLFFEGRNLFDFLSFKLGRQPLFNSIAGGIFDGINLDLKTEEFKLSGYYGGNVPAYQKLEITDQWKDDYILGGKFTTTALKDFRISLGYINKNFRKQEYNALRLDEDLNPISVLIKNKSNQYEFLSGEIGYDLGKIFSIDTRYDYDLNFNKTSKFEVFGSYFQIAGFNFNVYYNYREPRIRYNSIFSVFDYGNSQEIEVGADYSINKFITINGKFGNVNYKDENSGRITIGASSSFGNISYRKTLGYAGELDAVSIYSAYTFLEGMLTPSLGLTYTSYKLSEDSEKNNLATVLAGVNYRPWKDLSFDLQGQYMNNKIYKNDYRIFFKLNYWFNTNLNLM